MSDPMRHPSLLVSSAVVTAVAAAWIYARMYIATESFVPLSYAVPLMACVWTRRTWQLAAMSAVFFVAAFVELYSAGHMVERQAAVVLLATIFNITIAALVIAAFIRLRGSLEANAAELEARNAEVTSQAEELAEQSEELAQQNEEIQSQSEEMERQNEELRQANDELERRESLLELFLGHARRPQAEDRSLDEVCRTMLHVLGEPAISFVVLERREGILEVTSSAGPEGATLVANQIPFAGSIAELVMAEGRTAYIDDLAARPDIAVPALLGTVAKSALAAPIYARGRACGAVVACGDEACHWSQEQFRTVEWLAIQCSLFLESKLNHDVLRESEERFRATFEQAPIGIAHASLDGRWLRVNQRYCDILGYSREELLQLTFQDVTHPDDLPKDMAALQRLDKSQSGTFSLVKRYVRKSGEVVWASVTGAIVKTGQDGTPYYVATAEDITGRREAEEDLRRRAEEVERLLEVVPAAVWVSKDPQCLQIVGNRRANEFYEAGSDENVSATSVPETRIFYSADGRRLAAEELPMQLAAATNRDIRDVELHVVTPSQRHMAMLGSAVPLRDGKGEVRGCIGAFMDITDRHRAEAAMRAAKEAAEAASLAKDQFLAALSHELRTPLTPALTAAMLMENDTRLTAEHREDAAMIRRNILLETRLIDDLLDVTRINRGKLELNLLHVDMCELLGHSMGMCSAEADAKGIRMSLELGEIEGCAVRGDRERLQQVFWNILKNATKFTGANGCVTVRGAIEKQGDSYNVVIDTTDTGRGIDPALLPRLFKPFEQGDPAITREFGGLGLGLSICRSLVELHGGSIEAHSDGRGKGSRFRIRLPLADSAPVTAGPGHHRPASVAGIRPLEILLVEDHPDTARIMMRVLKSAGHTVHRASSVATGLEIAGKVHFDLVLSDLGLPDGSGLDLMRSLRQIGRYFHAIALSGFGTDSDRQQSAQAGFDAHLTKPVDLGLLAETIRNITNHRANGHLMAAHNEQSSSVT